MKKILLSISTIFLLSFSSQKENKEYWALVGTVNDFTILKKVVDKCPDSDTMKKKVLDWINYKLRRLK